LPVVPDDEPGAGPLAATLTALRQAGGAVTVVLSCDLVAPSPRAIAAVVGAVEGAPPDAVAAVPLVDGHLQWTHAAWRPAALALLSAEQAQGARSLRRACARLAIVAVEGIPPAAVADADHPGDLPTGR
jgi:molybdopterin-guanine dinucleotide biosynthesis protein A